jgi:AcrR family transcriptional regulator
LCYYQTDGRFVIEKQMPRTLDPAAHAIRRESFLDAAQRLIQSKGYDEMSVQDVLDELDASKGAFYHYFDSKEALLGGVVDRMVEVATAKMAQVADDPSLTAVQKLNSAFATLAEWKDQQRELMAEFTRIWFSDANIVVREQLRQGVVRNLTPLLARIIGQGKAEGVITASSAEHTAGVLVAVLMGANETASRLFVARQAGKVTYEDVIATLSAYGEAYERILGLAPGSWPLLDGKVLHAWFD